MCNGIRVLQLVARWTPRPPPPVDLPAADLDGSTNHDEDDTTWERRHLKLTGRNSFVTVIGDVLGPSQTTPNKEAQHMRKARMASIWWRSAALLSSTTPMASMGPRKAPPLLVAPSPGDVPGLA
jgi:hypothetical protein